MSNQPIAAPSSRLFHLGLAAVLGATATFSADSIVRGGERAEQFAAVKEILTRLEKKVDEDFQRHERGVDALNRRVTSIAASHSAQINANQTAIAVLAEQVRAGKGVDP